MRSPSRAVIHTAFHIVARIEITQYGGAFEKTVLTGSRAMSCSSPGCAGWRRNSARVVHRMKDCHHADRVQSAGLPGMSSAVAPSEDVMALREMPCTADPLPCAACKTSGMTMRIARVGSCCISVGAHDGRSQDRGQVRPTLRPAPH